MTIFFFFLFLAEFSLSHRLWNVAAQGQSIFSAVPKKPFNIQIPSSLLRISTLFLYLHIPFSLYLVL